MSWLEQRTEALVNKANYDLMGPTGDYGNCVTFTKYYDFLYLIICIPVPVIFSITVMQYARSTHQKGAKSHPQ